VKGEGRMSNEVMRGRQDRMSSFIFGLIGGGAILEGISLSPGSFHRPGPGFLPLAGGILLVVLAIVVFVASFSDQEIGPRLWAGGGWLRTIKTVGMLCIFPITLRWLGFILSAAFTMSFLFRHFGLRRWPVIIGVSIGVSLVCYVLFAILLGSELPQGILGLL
jgi:putative tricarboxylic transport membrane protein